MKRIARNRWLVPLAVAALTVLAFLPALQNGFVSWDDDKNFLANPDYRGLAPANLRWMWSTFLLGHYVPLSWMTLGLDYVFWGMNPLGYHLTNVLLHAANAVLVYFIARRIFEVVDARRTNDRRHALLAAVAALLFAVHPLRVESVAWITERRDVLSGFFYFAAVLAYMRHASSFSMRDASRVSTRDAANVSMRGASDASASGTANWRWYWLSLVLFLCALLSKATAVTLPVVLLILNIYPLRRLGGAAGWWTEWARRIYASLVPFALLSAATATMTFVALQPVPQLDVAGKVAVSSYSVAFYLWKTLLPVRLSPLYPMPPVVEPAAARYVVGYVVVLTLVALALLMRRKAPGVTAACVAFAAIMFPMLGVHQNGPQITADRYTYFAAPVLAILAAAGLARLASRDAVRVAITVVVIAALGALTWRQTGVWHDSRSLWAHALAIDAESPIAQNNWGNLLMERDSVDQAIAHYRKALSLTSGFAQVHNSLGIALSRRGEFGDAIEQYRAALAIEPDYDEPDGNWGVTLARQGRFDEAIQHYQRAVALNPNNADAHVNWGNALVAQARFAEAIPHYQEAVRIRPNHAEAHLNWGVALARQGDYGSAIEQFRGALQINPNLAEAQMFLDRAVQLQRR